MLGVHHGHSPCAIDQARNCTCGKNCDFASQGMVTAPESHGQVGSRKASAKMAMVAGSAMPLAAPADCSCVAVAGSSFGHREVASPSTGTGGSLIAFIPLFPALL